MKTIYCKNENEFNNLCVDKESRERTLLFKNDKTYIQLHCKGANNTHIVYEYLQNHAVGAVIPSSNGLSRNSSLGVIALYQKSLTDLFQNLKSPNNENFLKLISHYSNTYECRHKKKFKGFDKDTSEVITLSTHQTLDDFCEKTGSLKPILVDEILSIPEISSNPKNIFIKQAFENISESLIEQGTAI